MEAILVDLDAALTQVEELLSQPSAIIFEKHQDDFVALEKILKKVPLIDAHVAASADMADAGRLFKSGKTATWLCTALDISRAEANARLHRAAELHGSPHQGSDPEKEARTQARRQAAQRGSLSMDKLDRIERELAELNPETEKRPEELFRELVLAANTMTPDELTSHARDVVRAQNKANPDPLQPWRQRTAWVADPDPNGGVRFGGYLPPGPAALLYLALGLNRRPASEDPAHPRPHGSDPLDKEDKRTPRQRRADAFIELLKTHAAGEAQSRGGLASLVISMSAKDLVEGPETGYFPTNTPAELTALDVLGLGITQHGFGVLHDPDSGVALSAGRFKRSASLAQRLALFAEQLVCGTPGCSHAAYECQAHHIADWISGGRTDIENLMFVCPPHHQDNDDTRTKPNRGFHDRDSQGRPGYRAFQGAPVEHNVTAKARRSGGAKVRDTTWGWANTSA